MLYQDLEIQHILLFLLSFCSSGGIKIPLLTVFDTPPCIAREKKSWRRLKKCNAIFQNANF